MPNKHKALASVADIIRSKLPWFIPSFNQIYIFPPSTIPELGEHPKIFVDECGQIHLEVTTSAAQCGMNGCVRPYRSLTSHLRRVMIKTVNEPLLDPAVRPLMRLMYTGFPVVKLLAAGEDGERSYQIMEECEPFKRDFRPAIDLAKQPRLLAQKIWELYQGMVRLSRHGFQITDAHGNFAIAPDGSVVLIDLDHRFKLKHQGTDCAPMQVLIMEASSGSEPPCIQKLPPPEYRRWADQNRKIALLGPFRGVDCDDPLAVKAALESLCRLDCDTAVSDGHYTPPDSCTNYINATDLSPDSDLNKHTSSPPSTNGLTSDFIHGFTAVITRRASEKISKRRSVQDAAYFCCMFLLFYGEQHFVRNQSNRNSANLAGLNLLSLMTMQAFLYVAQSLFQRIGNKHSKLASHAGSALLAASAFWSQEPSATVAQAAGGIVGNALCAYVAPPSPKH